MAEHVQLPGGRRLGAHHVALKAHPVHEVSDGRLGAGQIRVRLVVGTAHDLHAALGDEAAQVGAVLRVGVPVRLEVVDLGEHELVFGFPARHFEVRGHEVEPVGLPAATGWLLGPQAGVGGLGVPPDRVVVEVADHEHRPARLGDDELEVGAVALEPHARRAALAGYGVAHLDGHLGDAAGGVGHGRLGRGQPVALDDDRRCAAGVGDPDQCSGASGGPTKRSVDSAEVTPNATTPPYVVTAAKRPQRARDDPRSSNSGARQSSARSVGSSVRMWSS